MGVVIGNGDPKSRRQGSRDESTVLASAIGIVLAYIFMADAPAPVQQAVITIVVVIWHRADPRV
jgi:hypothetical protein